MKTILLFLSINFLLFVHIQAQNAQNPKNAISSLRNLPKAVDQVKASITATNFGPFRLSGECGYDSHWYCFGDCMTSNWWFEFPNFVWIKDNLQARYQNVTTVAKEFDNAFLPIEHWLKDELLGLTVNFDSQMDRIAEQTKELNDPSKSETLKKLTKTSISNQMTVMCNDLARAAQKLDSGLVNLVAFSNKLEGALNSIVSLRTQVESAIQSNHDWAVTKTNEMNCNQAYAMGEIENIENGVRGQYQSVLGTASSFGVTAESVRYSIGSISGMLLSVLGQFQETIQKFQNAEMTPEGAVQALRLNVTYLSLKDLAVYANEKLGK